MKGSLLKPVASLMLVIFVIVGCAAPAAPVAPAPPTATPGPLDVVAAFRAAVAARDIDAILAVFTEDAEWRHNGAVFINGHDELREWFGYMIGLEYTELEADCKPAPNPGFVKCRVVRTNAPYGQADAEYLAEVEGDRIKVFYFSDMLGAEAGSRFDAFMAWAQAVHPDETKRIFAEFGKDAYNQALGESVTKLSDEWQASLTAPAAADPLDVAQAYADAMAKGDADAALALFADDAKLVDETGTNFATGRDAIRNFLAYGTAQEYREYDTECAATANSDVIECHALWKVIIIPDGEGTSTYYVTVKEGKITLLDTTDDHWDAAAEANSGAFFAWFSATHPDDLKRIFDSIGRYEFSRELGEQIADAYHEWEATKLTPTPAPSTADPLKVVAAFRAALAKHDVDKMMALFNENAEWRHNEGQTVLTFKGLDEMQNFLGYYAVALDYKELRGACSLTPDKARVHCKVQARNIPYGSFVVTYDAAIAGDRIGAVEFTEDLDAAAQARHEEFVDWAKTAHPEEMARLDAEFGKNAFNQALGEAIAALHKEWQAAKPTPVPVAAAVPEVVQKFRDAMADRDIEAVIALFTDTGEWRQAGGMAFKGRAELEPWLGYVFGLRYRELEATCEGTPQPALTKCEARATSALFGKHGATYYIEVTGDKISAVLWQDNIGPEADAHANDYARWLAATHPEENARIWEGLGHKSGYNRELGELIAETYDEWEASQE